MKPDILTILALVFGLGMAASSLGLTESLAGEQQQKQPASALHQGVLTK
ncbi:MAG: hypothetical protein K6L73_08715 [Cellvibrionaceae bacterium]